MVSEEAKDAIVDNVQMISEEEAKEPVVNEADSIMEVVQAQQVEA
jgi:hypothetical protein